MTAEPVQLMSTWIDLLALQSIYATVVFAAVWTVARLLRRRGPAVLYVLWALVFIRLVLPPGLSHPWSAGALVDRLAGQPLVSIGLDSARGDADAIGRSATSSIASIEGTDGGGLSWKAILAVVWLVGVLAILATHRRRMVTCRRVVADARPVTSPAQVFLIEGWRRRFRVRRRVRVVSSKNGFGPFTIGVLRPVIFIPASVASDAKSFEPAIAHEMAHVARWDALWLLAQHAVHAFYFFHPLVWISGARLNEERERLCDASVVAAGRLTARDYLGGLLNVLRLDLRVGVGAPTMNARKRRIRVRVRTIIENEGEGPPRLAMAIACATVVGVFLLPLAGNGMGAESLPQTTTDRQVAEQKTDKGDAGFVNPVPASKVSWRWGPGRDPFTKEEVLHRGIDLAAKAGTPVLAPADGVVTVATVDYAPSPAAGTVIIVDHGNGITTYYAHLGSLEVEEGQRVKQRDVIAAVGSTGKSTGPHLHFEVRRNGSAEDPAAFIADWK